MEQTTLDYIRKRDYLHGEDNLARVRQNEAQLRWGHHWDTPPLVTVAIHAYRRVALLERLWRGCSLARRLADQRRSLPLEC